MTPAAEAARAVRSFRRRFGTMPDPDNPLHARWLCAQLSPDSMDRLIDEVFVEMTQEVLDELVAEGRAEVVGTSATGSPIYRKVDR